jgi:hypothetical protein
VQARAAPWAPEPRSVNRTSGRPQTTYTCPLDLDRSRPFDVSAVEHWTKIMMTFQSAVSLLLAVLVIARAIDLLP